MATAQIKRLSLASIRTDNGKKPLLMSSTASGVFIVGSATENPDGTTSFSISEKPVEHRTTKAAANEAERLALQNPGKSFVVLQALAAVKASGTSWG